MIQNKEAMKKAENAFLDVKQKFLSGSVDAAAYRKAKAKLREDRAEYRDKVRGAAPVVTGG